MIMMEQQRQVRFMNLHKTFQLNYSKRILIKSKNQNEYYLKTLLGIIAVHPKKSVILLLKIL